MLPSPWTLIGCGPKYSLQQALLGRNQHKARVGSSLQEAHGIGRIGSLKQAQTPTLQTVQQGVQVEGMTSLGGGGEGKAGTSPMLGTKDPGLILIPHTLDQRLWVILQEDGKKAQMTKDVKLKMKELIKHMKSIDEASSESELPPREEKPAKADTDSESSSSLHVSRYAKVRDESRKRVWRGTPRDPPQHSLVPDKPGMAGDPRKVEEEEEDDDMEEVKEEPGEAEGGPHGPSGPGPGSGGPRGPDLGPAAVEATA
eukprot:s5694_g3.t1